MHKTITRNFLMIILDHSLQARDINNGRNLLSQSYKQTQYTPTALISIHRLHHQILIYFRHPMQVPPYSAEVGNSGAISSLFKRFLDVVLKEVNTGTALLLPQNKTQIRI